MNRDTRRYWIDWTRKGPDGRPGLITSDFTDETDRVIRSFETRAATAPINPNDYEDTKHENTEYRADDGRD